MYPVKILWATHDGKKELYGSMAPVTEVAYHARGGKAEALPGRARISGGRSDIHFLTDGAGELFADRALLLAEHQQAGEGVIAEVHVWRLAIRIA